jgi:hypothetical protein
MTCASTAGQAGTPAVRGHGTAAGHSHSAPNAIDPQGPGRSGRNAIAPGPGLDGRLNRLAALAACTPAAWPGQGPGSTRSPAIAP